jgi:sec-independent protein translocase protein TatA
VVGLFVDRDSLASEGDIAMFGVGTQELLIVCVVALLLFGNRLPSVMRSLGSGISEFKKGMNEIQNDLRRSIDDTGKQQ